MARHKGNYIIPGNIEPQTTKPLDSRMVVDTSADLFKKETWESRDEKVYVYPGMVVATAGNNPEIWKLRNHRLGSDDYKDSSNWDRVDGSEDYIAWLFDHNSKKIRDAYLRNEFVFVSDDTEQDLPAEAWDSSRALTHRAGMELWVRIANVSNNLIDVHDKITAYNTSSHKEFSDHVDVFDEYVKDSSVYFGNWVADLSTRLENHEDDFRKLRDKIQTAIVYRGSVKNYSDLYDVRYTGDPSVGDMYNVYNPVTYGELKSYLTGDDLFEVTNGNEYGDSSIIYGGGMNFARNPQGRWDAQGASADGLGTMISENTVSIVDVSSKLIGVSEGLIDVSAKLIDVSANLIDVSAKLIDTSSHLLDTSKGLFDLSTNLLAGKAYTIRWKKIGD